MQLHLVIWLLSMIELTSVSIGAIPFNIEVFAFLCAVVLRNMGLNEKLMLTMSKCTLRSILALTHLPVSAYFSFEFLLKVRSGSTHFPGLDCFNFAIVK